MPSDELKQKWRDHIEDAPIKSCGRLDLSTELLEAVTVGRVTSDRIRYVYFEDGEECVVLGEHCDFVAFKAADYHRRTPPSAPKLPDWQTVADHVRAAMGGHDIGECVEAIFSRFRDSGACFVTPTQRGVIEAAKVWIGTFKGEGPPTSLYRNPLRELRDAVEALEREEGGVDA